MDLADTRRDKEIYFDPSENTISRMQEGSRLLESKENLVETNEITFESNVQNP